MPPDVMPRLRAANPCTVDAERAHQPIAQAALQQILAAPAPPSSTARRTITPRGLVLILAVLLLGAGGALAATDPMGWWSNDPSQAHYRINPGIRVRAPAAQQIRCRTGGGGHFDCRAALTRCSQIGQRAPHCSLSGAGLPYLETGTVQAPPRNSLLSRAGFTRAIAKALAAGTVTTAQAAEFRSDLARVPGSFFTEMRLASRYGTYGAGGTIRNGKELVPPIGQPGILVCTEQHSQISCQNINGDSDTPVGAGVYAAMHGPGWRWVTAPRYIGGLPPGVHFTRADDRVLIDLLRIGGAVTHHVSGLGHATTVPIVHLPPTRSRTSHPK